MHCGAKILYYADACDKFAEHELDYILFAKVSDEQITSDDTENALVNLDEVKNTIWLGRRDLDGFLEERNRLHGE